MSRAERLALPERLDPARRRIEFVVPEGPGTRLDLFLAGQDHGLSRRLTRELIATGVVHINGRRARKGEIVHPHDVVRIDGNAWYRPVELAAQRDLPVRILHEDATIIAVHKPTGMPALALRNGDRDTVANFLVAHFPELRSVGVNPLEAGLVHRLDTGTSGVMLAARTEEAYSALRQQFRRRKVDKLYLALVRGKVSVPGVIRTPIAHAGRRRRQMCVCPTPERAQALRARPAITLYRPISRFESTSFVAIVIPTGIRHQIRVHLASIGHPLLGDPLYGHPGAPAMDVPRLMLHATRVRFRHPSSTAQMAISVPLPPDFRSVLRQVREQERSQR